MAQKEAGRLPQVLARVGASHGITDLACKLRFYDEWAPEYDLVSAPGSLWSQDHATLTLLSDKGLPAGGAVEISPTIV